MRCLVTGAAGFIGSHLSARLVAEGHEVVGFDNLSEGSQDNLAGAGEVRLEVGDLRDENAVSSAAKGCEVIFHQGAIRSVPRSMEQPGLTTDANVRGTLNVLLAAADHGARVVFASSSSAYGDLAEFPLREDMRPEPRSPYAASKLAGEIYCATWWRAFGVPAMSLRYFNVYGPRQDPTNEYATAVPRFILACLDGRQLVVHGDGNQARDFTYIDDAVEANQCAAGAGEDAFGRVFNIGGGQRPTSINDVVKKIGELTGTTPQIRHTDPRPGDVRLTEADVSSAGRLLGYKPQASIDEGLARTVKWFKENREMYK
ncbi:MAG: NAD-dependent epimerase/dehydratase family protein [Actinomycetota bacterium]|nr:NAD-dependent epimerase/dehydratase family protein [Actinomycetota bacterium]